MLDGVAQTRLVLHLYNAFLRLALLEPIALLEMLIQALSREGQPSALWADARPDHAFTDAFHHAWGVDAADFHVETSPADPKMKPRALIAVDPLGLSAALR